MVYEYSQARLRPFNKIIHHHYLFPLISSKCVTFGKGRSGDQGIQNIFRARMHLYMVVVLHFQWGWNGPVLPRYATSTGFWKNTLWHLDSLSLEYITDLL